MNYAILDIETTGGSPTYEKITEIAIFIHDGKTVNKEFHSLINPEKTIPTFITGLTGITNEMVADAPKFYEIAKDIVEITKDCIIVGHNVSFDYRFIQSEFKRLGYAFRRESLCTVKLSRKLIPGHKSYSLGKLCKELDISINERHRASGDALATVKLFELLMHKEEEMATGLIRTSSSSGKYKNLNGFLLPEQINDIPGDTGVYYLHDSSGNLLYVGKSKNIHTRLLAHLGNKKTRRAIELSEKIAGISFELTGSELTALLLESEEIKKHKPLYNRAQRRNSTAWALYSFYDNKGYINFELKQTGKTNTVPITSFNNKAEGRELLNRLTEKYWLCQKLTGLYLTEGACFHHEIRQCNGACIGKEPTKVYNERAQKLIKSFTLEVNNLIIIDKGRTIKEKSFVLMEKGIYKGYGYFDTRESYLNIDELKNRLQKGADNRESRDIIRFWLRKNKAEKLIHF